MISTTSLVLAQPLGGGSRVKAIAGGAEGSPCLWQLLGSLITHSIIKRCLLTTAVSCFLAANGAGERGQQLPCTALRARRWV